MARLRTAVIGVGHLGKEHARILAQLPDVELVGVADVNAEQAQTVARRCGTRAFTSYWPLLNLVDAAVIAVPTTCHHDIAKDFLSHGIPLLVEKPLASTLEQADDLVGLARGKGTLLQVGHIERFNPAFEALRERPLQPTFVECQRLGPFTGRSTDIGVILDLMIHDLDLLLTLVQAPVRSVEAVGVIALGGHEDAVHARLSFENGCVAEVTGSRISSRPVRRMQVWAPQGYANLDFVQRHLTLAQPSPHRNHLDSLPAGRALSPEQLLGQYFQVLELDCDHGDQLTRELQDFVRCVQTGARPRVNGEDGQNAIALAARIRESLRTHHWDGSTGGLADPSQLPPPLGSLFHPAA